MRAHPSKLKNVADKDSLLSELLINSQRHAEFVRVENENSVDILVDLNLIRQGTGDSSLDAVEEADDNPSLEFFIRSMFEHYGVDYEEFDDRGHFCQSRLDEIHR